MIIVRSDLAGVKILPAFLNPPIETIAKMARKQEQSQDTPALTARMSRGDEAAFREFYNHYFNRLLRYVIVVANGREEIAHEAVQITFVRIARHVRKFDSETAFWNWLAMLARNCVVDELRKRNRYQGLLSRFFQQRQAGIHLKENEADEQFLKLLETEIAGLPSDERMLIEQKYFDGETAGHLAAERQVTEKAIESRLLRIRRKLKTVILDRLKNETE